MAKKKIDIKEIKPNTELKEITLFATEFRELVRYMERATEAAQLIQIQLEEKLKKLK